jgi:hypothetical protein
MELLFRLATIMSGRVSVFTSASHILGRPGGVFRQRQRPTAVFQTFQQQPARDVAAVSDAPGPASWLPRETGLEGVEPGADEHKEFPL